ncbi:MAG: sigma-70 family RNA polymerase sigma factor [Planctomycetales bacterium]|nr:sigma-70 family RNA polymerase sigma factor [Planctomycetales bacterium]
MAAGNFPKQLRVPIHGAVVSDDQRLIDQALGGDAAAFGLLVHKYQQRLFNTLVHLAGCREEAEDLMQDAFVQAFVKLDSFRGQSSFYTWLYRIAFNLTISLRRKRRLENSHEHAPIVPANEPLDDRQDASEHLELREQADQVHMALGALAEDRRDILILRDIEGFSYEQIAEILDLPIGTVRSRIHRARLDMRNQLTGIWQENSAD